MELFEIFIRAILSLFILFIITKIIGKKQVSELCLFDYVIGISIGNFAAEMTVNTEINYMNGVVAILVFGVLAYLINFLTMKSIVLRRFFVGTPTTLIQNGHIVMKNLKKVKFDINDLLEECRNNGYFDLSEIEFGIMEANGKLSVLSKANLKPLTPKDMKIKVSSSTLCGNVIIDGKIMKNNLKNMNKDIEWLMKELKIRGIDISNVLLATLDNSEKLCFYLKDDEIYPLEVLE